MAARCGGDDVAVAIHNFDLPSNFFFVVFFIERGSSLCIVNRDRSVPELELDL